MRVQTSLRISVAFAMVSMLIVALMLFTALHKVRNAMERAEIAGDIANAVFERSTFRNDYLQSNSQRAKRQWFAKHEEIRAMLSVAARKEWSAEEKLLVGEMISNYRSVGKLFTAIVAAREKIPPRPPETPEAEERLLTQLNMRIYDTALHARRLQEASKTRLFAVVSFAGLSVLVTLGIVITAVVLTAWNINRTVTDRVARLHLGAAAVGAGNLAYRIGLQGDDEFVELSEAFDEMTEKLHRSYYDLEREVAERTRAEKALRESEARFRGTFENAAVGISLFDRTGHLIRANGKLCEILGYTEEELRGRSFASFTHPDDQEPDMTRFGHLMNGELPSYSVEKRYVRKDDRPVWVRVTRSAQPDEQNLRAYCISIVINITARKKAEEERERLLAEVQRSNEDLQQFAHVASHDLQEPLRMVSSYMQLLDRKYRERLDEKAAQYIHHAVDGTVRMQKLITGLLNYSRINREVERLPVDTGSVCAAAIANLEQAIRDSGGEVTADPLPTVPGEETQLVQLFQNLIGNGLKYRKPGIPPRVHISARQEGPEWRYSVVDNGIGILPQFRDRIFQIFQRLHTREEYPGTGIGLATCKKIVEGHGGRIWVESTPGESSVFHFTLPVK